MKRDELLRKWVAALESGQYKQAEMVLRDGNSYCCLGVLCDLSGDGKWVIQGMDDDIEYEFDAGELGHCKELLPERYRKHIGLTTPQQTELANANDQGETFAEIARRIRNMFPDVFAVAT